MKVFHYCLGIFCALCLMVIFLITSVEAVAYWTPGFYETEYTKYGVADVVDMEMEDLLDVTQKMMAFLRGDRDDLHVETIMGGEQREFFNSREIAHMEDVKGLFLAALSIRRIALAAAAGCVILLFLLKANVKKILPKTLCIGTGLFFALAAILTLIISTDFSKYFVLFHKIFFNNDLWILNPETDMLINIVPEPFFVDTALRIGITFGASVLLLFILCLVYSAYLRCSKKN